VFCVVLYDPHLIPGGLLPRRHLRRFSGIFPHVADREPLDLNSLLRVLRSHLECIRFRPIRHETIWRVGNPRYDTQAWPQLARCPGFHALLQKGALPAFDLGALLGQSIPGATEGHCRLLNLDCSMGGNPTVCRAKSGLRHLEEEPLSAMLTTPLLIMNHFSIMRSLATFFRTELCESHLRPEVFTTILARLLNILSVLFPIVLTLVSNSPYH